MISRFPQLEHFNLCPLRCAVSWLGFQLSPCCVTIFLRLTGNDLYLVARRDPNGPYWNQDLSWLPWELQHDINLAAYSLQSHRSSLFRVSQEKDDVEWLFDIPGCGDTAFPSIVRVDQHTYIIVNYTSPTGECANWPWLWGQVNPDGTQIYFLLVTFEPQQ